MPNIVSAYQNEQRWEIEAQCDLSAAGAVGTTRGTNVVFAKTGTGTYTCTVKGASALKLYEILDSWASLQGTPATVFWARVTGITQTASTDDVVISITLLTNAATPVAADTTGAITLSVGCVLRTSRMSNPL